MLQYNVIIQRVIKHCKFIYFNYIILELEIRHILKITRFNHRKVDEIIELRKLLIRQRFSWYIASTALYSETQNNTRERDSNF